MSDCSPLTPYSLCPTAPFIPHLLIDENDPQVQMVRFILTDDSEGHITHVIAGSGISQGGWGMPSSLKWLA